MMEIKLVDTEKKDIEFRDMFLLMATLWNIRDFTAGIKLNDYLYLILL